jgi:GalNAc5-diNAcBac-PP-undecaprenol beta-1,3-glucosyltransferase
MTPVATVIVPTTGDRGPLLPFSLGSVLAQDEAAIEVFVIGDGVDDATRAVVRGIAARDPRVRFFDHPKHPRRGEEYRHAALAEANGEIVCYLTDRDLMLPGHVGELATLLRDADLAYTLRLSITEAGPAFTNRLDARDPAVRRRMVAGELPIELPFSCTGHRLDAYRRLPHGWRTTPPHWFTDQYMWRQFLADPAVRVAAGARATIVYLKRGDHPGWPVERRRAELERWSERMRRPGFAEAFAEDAVRALLDDQARLALAAARPLRRWLRGVLYRHETLGALVLTGAAGGAARRLARAVFRRGGA